MELTGPTVTIRRAKKLRRETTLPEALLWRHLRARPAGLKFRRRCPAGRYVLDFYCDAARLAVEADGEAHGRGDRPAHHAERDAWLAARGVRTRRIAARVVPADRDAVVRHVVAVARAAPSTSFAGSLLPAGEE